MGIERDLAPSRRTATKERRRQSSRGRGRERKVKGSKRVETLAHSPHSTWERRRPWKRSTRMDWFRLR